MSFPSVSFECLSQLAGELFHELKRLQYEMYIGDKL